MQRRNLLSCAVVALILSVIFTQVVSAQGISFARITKVDAPATVVHGQSLTVSITAAYFVNSPSGQSLRLAIEDHTQNGNPFPTTASPSNSCYAPANVSICFAQTAMSGMGDYTVTFTLTAPNQPETWNLYVFAQVVQLGFTSWSVVNGTVKVVQVVVT